MSHALPHGPTLHPVQEPAPLSQPTRGTRGRALLLVQNNIPLILLALLVAATVAAAWPLAVPPTLPNGIIPNGFSADRALADLAVITAQPRVPGTQGLLDARAYFAQEFAAIGLTPELHDAIVQRQSAEAGVGILAQAHNVVARLPGTENSGAVIIAGHLDSVHTTTGASDCGGCAVSVLEVARALVAGPPLRNDVIFLIEDGEETTRAGALSFVEQHPWAQDVRVALNQEAMGSGGASLLYVTGPDNGWLIAEALKVMPAAVAYSFVNDLVWFTGTGGSDLDQFLMVAPVGLGLVYVGNVPVYHTTMDNIANLDPRTLQHRGDQMVALARHFGNLPLDGTLTATSQVYFTLVNGVTVRYPAWVALLLAGVAVVAYVGLVVGGLKTGRIRGQKVLVGALLLWPITILATALCGALWFTMRLLDTRLQVFLIGISYDRAWYTLAFILLAAALTIGAFALFRRTRWMDLGVGVLGWWIVLGMLAAWRAPGSSPMLTLPALLALLPLAWVVMGRAETQRWVYTLLLGVAAAGALLLVAPTLNFLGIFSGRAELIMNLPVIALLPAPLTALLAALLLPAWMIIGQWRRWVVPVGLTVAALAILIGVGVTAEFTPTRPKPNMVAYVMEEGAAQWVTVAGNVQAGRVDGRGALLDEWTTQFFPTGARPATFNPWGAFFMGADYEYPAYVGPAPLADYPAPELAGIEEGVNDNGLRIVNARITLRQQAPMHVLRFEADAGIVGVQLLGESFTELATAAQPARVVWVELYGIEATTLDLMLTLAGEGVVRVQVEERFYALPDLPGVEISPRPAWMMASPTFVTDSALVRTNFELP